VSATPAAIEIANLRKDYGRRSAIRDLTLTVGQGEVFGFLGPNGAGKSTTIKILVGLVAPTDGSAAILGRDVRDPDARADVGYLPENFKYHDWLTGEGVLDLHGCLAGMDSADRARRIPRVLATVGLADRGGDRLRGYSKGMTQRIGLAVALLHQPRVVLLDEPTSALDPVGRREVRDIIRRLRDEGVTVFLNSHLLGEVELVCDRVAIVNEGWVVAAGTPGELVRSGRRLRITLDRVDDAVIALVGPIAEVVDVDDDQLIIDVDDADHVATVVDAMVHGGYRVFAVVPERASLEDEFVRLVSGG
jgi:ABC-2 type transport system ATP-binding protein